MFGASASWVGVWGVLGDGDGVEIVFGITTLVGDDMSGDFVVGVCNAGAFGATGDDVESTLGDIVKGTSVNTSGDKVSVLVSSPGSISVLKVGISDSALKGEGYIVGVSFKFKSSTRLEEKSTFFLAGISLGLVAPAVGGS